MNPMSILVPEREEENKKIFSRRKIPCSPFFSGSSLRGSAGPIFFNSLTLFLFHEVIHEPEGRKYLHRFVCLNIDIRKKISKNCSGIKVSFSSTFTFEKNCIEYALSMVLIENMLHIGVGLEDRQAKIYSLPLEKVLSMCHY
jgi:hypothetical protein